MNLIELFVVFWILFQYISIQFSEKTHNNLLSLFTLYVTIGLILLNENREFFSFLTLSIFAGGIAILTFVWSINETLTNSSSNNIVTYFLTENVLILGLIAIFILNYDTPELNTTDGEEINLEEMFTHLFNEDNCTGILTLFVLSLLLLILLTTANLNTAPNTNLRTAFDFTTDRALDMSFYQRTTSTASFGSFILPALRFIAKLIIYIVLIVPLLFNVFWWSNSMYDSLYEDCMFSELNGPNFINYPIPLIYGPRANPNHAPQADFSAGPDFEMNNEEENHPIVELAEYYNNVSMSQELHESASIMTENVVLFLENTYNSLPNGSLIVCFIIFLIYLLTPDVCWEFMENWINNLWNTGHWSPPEHNSYLPNSNPAIVEPNSTPTSINNSICPQCGNTYNMWCPCWWYP